MFILAFLLCALAAVNESSKVVAVKPKQQAERC